MKQDVVSRYSTEVKYHAMDVTTCDIFLLTLATYIYACWCFSAFPFTLWQQHYDTDCARFFSMSRKTY